MIQIPQHGFTTTNSPTCEIHACICGFGQPGTNWRIVDQHISDAATVDDVIDTLVGDGRMAARNAFDELLARRRIAEHIKKSSLRALEKWVPTHELLPPENAWVLIVRQISDRDVVEEAQWVPWVPWAKRDGPWLVGGKYIPERSVSHWQFKPEPPKGRA